MINSVFSTITSSINRIIFLKRSLSISRSNLYKFNPKRMEENKVNILHHEQKMMISFRYVNENHNINKVLTFNRTITEQACVLLKRIEGNISKIINTKIKFAKKEGEGELTATEINVDIIEKDSKDLLNISNMSFYDIMKDNHDQYLLKVNEIIYSFCFNPPIMDDLNIITKNIMAGYLLRPAKLECRNCVLDDVQFTWYKSKNTYSSMEDVIFNDIVWEKAGESLIKTVENDEIGKVLKIVAVPYNGDKKGMECEALARVLVSPGPGKCPFESRHQFTCDIADSNSLRVVSYNILADLYADSDFSRTKLFPTCPPYALAISYRIQLLIKEILGYNGDIICLQETDAKVFKRYLQPIFLHNGLDGIFKSKGPSNGEGLATFYRKDKLELIEVCNFSIKEELETNILFTDMLEKIKLNEKAYKFLSARVNILMVSVFASKSDPNKRVVVGSTHLFFAPLADHVRLVQASVCLSLIQQVLEMTKIKNPGCETAMIFCGDFNSCPENAVYRYMTTQCILEDDPEWSSTPEENLTGISLSHNLELDSACGTPSYTNYAIGFNGCLDYIYYETDKLSVTKNVPLPSHEEVTQHGALPSVTIPSDHLALVADLAWKNDGTVATQIWEKISRTFQDLKKN